MGRRLRTDILTSATIGCVVIGFLFGFGVRKATDGGGDDGAARTVAIESDQPEVTTAGATPVACEANGKLPARPPRGPVAGVSEAGLEDLASALRLRTGPATTFEELNDKSRAEVFKTKVLSAYAESNGGVLLIQEGPTQHGIAREAALQNALVILVRPAEPAGPAFPLESYPAGTVAVRSANPSQEEASLSSEQVRELADVVAGHRQCAPASGGRQE